MTPSNWATLIALLKCVVLYFALFNSVALAIRAWFAMANNIRKINETWSVRVVAALWALFYVLNLIHTA
jgi:hypothetical protein